MIYFFCGTDWEKARQEAGRLLDAEKKRGTEVVVIEDAGLTSLSLSELADSRGLFREKVAVFADNLVGDGILSEEDMLEASRAFRRADNALVILERNKLGAGFIKEMKTASDSFHAFDLPEVRERKLDNFALSDALMEKDRKKLWLAYRRAVKDGALAEEIQGMLFWGAQMMALAVLCRSASEAGVSPYPFSKARKAVANYGAEKSLDLPFCLTSLLHDSRRKGEELEVALERFVLSV